METIIIRATAMAAEVGPSARLAAPYSAAVNESGSFVVDTACHYVNDTPLAAADWYGWPQDWSPIDEVAAWAAEVVRVRAAREEEY